MNTYNPPRAPYGVTFNFPDAPARQPVEVSGPLVLDSASDKAEAAAPEGSDGGAPGNWSGSGAPLIAAAPAASSGTWTELSIGAVGPAELDAHARGSFPAPDALAVPAYDQRAAPGRTDAAPEPWPSFCQPIDEALPADGPQQAGSDETCGVNKGGDAAAPADGAKRPAGGYDGGVEHEAGVGEREPSLQPATGFRRPQLGLGRVDPQRRARKLPSTNPRRYVRGGGGGGRGSPPTAAAPIFPPDLGDKVSAGAISGSLLAVATLVRIDGSWGVADLGIPLFRLGGRTQWDSRKFALEFREFVTTEKITDLALCSTMSGSWIEGLQDEARIESLAMMVPGLAIKVIRNDAVADWSINNNPPPPDNMALGRMVLPQVRALETAQFLLANRQQE